MPAQLFHLGLDGVGGGERIGSRRLANCQQGGRLAVIAHLDIVNVRAQFDSTDVAEPDDGAAGVSTDWDSAEFLWCLQQVLDNDGSIEALAFHGWRGSNCPADTSTL